MNAESFVHMVADLQTEDEYRADTGHDYPTEDALAAMNSLIGMARDIWMAT